MLHSRFDGGRDSREVWGRGGGEGGRETAKGEVGSPRLSRDFGGAELVLFLSWQPYVALPQMGVFPSCAFHRLSVSVTWTKQRNSEKQKEIYEIKRRREAEMD